MTAAMQKVVRGLVTFAVAVSLVAAGGFTPRHAHAGKHAAKVEMSGSAQHGSGHHHGHHHHHAQAPAMACLDDAQAHPPSGSPIEKCCVAACSAIALSVAPAMIETRELTKADYGRVLARASIPANPASDDPPPR